eukprot:scaffold353948_cov46-Prasinocladus_malaysianus.AAC.1
MLNAAIRVRQFGHWRVLAGPTRQPLTSTSTASDLVATVREQQNSSGSTIKWIAARTTNTGSSFVQAQVAHAVGSAYEYYRTS